MVHTSRIVKHGIYLVFLNKCPQITYKMASQLPDPIEIEGIVHSIVFHNEENGFTIMQVDSPQDGRVTILGRLPAVVEGEEIRATGKWKSDRRFGKQLEAEHITAIPPSSKEGTERFLASGLIDGIGATYARRIVAKFGEDTLRVIEEESKRLEEVEGIGTARRQKIKESWNRQKSIRDIMIFLHANGLSTARALRLFKTYGPETVNVLRADPYRLASELPGIGFKTADEIAMKMGMSIDSPARLASGILYILEQAEKQGHCALPKKKLIEDAVHILDSPHSAIDHSATQLILDTRIIVEETDGQEFVYSRDLYEAEQSTANAITSFVNAPPNLPPVDADAAISWFERHNQIKLGDEQAKTVIEATRHRFFVITGGPGVGKTTILNAILQILAAKKVEPVLCAPTGRAAKRLSESTGREALTIHRALEFQPEVGFTRKAEKPLEGDLFIVDEASMIDIRLMANFMAAVPKSSTIILVGDVDQLPSVGAGSVLRDIIDSGVVPVSRLSTIYRQAEASHIVQAAHAVNKGKLPPLENKQDSDFFFIERTGPESITETLEYLIEERIPEGFHLHSRDEIQVLTPMNKHSLGTKALNAEIQKALNPPGELKFEIERFGNIFRTGDKVIQTRNNYEKEVFNGDIGHISEITTEPATISVTFDGNHRVDYEPGELDELQLAYAITIHKSQGSEFPAVVIPLASQQYVLLQRNLLYTAITRGKKVVILVGEKQALERAIRNEESSHRFTGLRSRLAISQSKEETP